MMSATSQQLPLYFRPIAHTHDHPTLILLKCYVFVFIVDQDNYKFHNPTVKINTLGISGKIFGWMNSNSIPEIPALQIKLLNEFSYFI